jgi:NTP pyrophosphatase (non-canonical NTP hydrolase)
MFRSAPQRLRGFFAGSLFIREEQEHLIALNGHRKTVDLHARIIAPRAVADVETPGVQGACDYAVGDVAFGETGTHVRTGIFDGMELAIHMKDGNDPVVGFDRAAFTGREVGGSSNGDSAGHRKDPDSFAGRRKYREVEASNRSMIGRCVNPRRSVNGLQSCAQPREEPLMENARADISLADFQQLIRRMYYEKDVARGVDGTFMWLMEEVGELASALRHGDRENLHEEFADVLAWLATIANVADVDLSAALAAKYGSGCPGCGLLVCTCPDAGKP